MNSTSTPNKSDARETMIARLEEANARAYQRAASKVVRADTPLSDPIHEAADHLPDELQTPFNTFVADDWPWRAFFGLLFVAFIVGGLIWALSNSDGVKQSVGGWASQSGSSSSQTAAKPEFPAQTSPANDQVDRTKVASGTGPQTQTALGDLAPITAVQFGQLSQWLQTMERDLATVKQGVERLEAGQEQLAHDNRKTAEQLKANQEQAVRDYANIAAQLEASQEQTARVMAKASKRNLRPKGSTPTSVPPLLPTR